jgi:DNA-binding HxlR family transcriptional regulator
MSFDCKNNYTCPVEATIELIGGKYKAIILWHLMGKTLRYSELHKLVSKATDKMLAQQLRELENDGLINRKVYPVVPPKTEYSLTDFGKTLAPILDALCNWGDEYLLKNSKISCYSSSAQQNK